MDVQLNGKEDISEIYRLWGKINNKTRPQLVEIKGTGNTEIIGKTQNSNIYIDENYSKETRAQIYKCVNFIVPCEITFLFLMYIVLKIGMAIHLIWWNMGNPFILLITVLCYFTELGFSTF